MASRAANGESSVYKGADGRWHGWVTVGLKPGNKPDRRHVTGKTRAAVIEQVRELERRREAGSITAAAIPTVAEWLGEAPGRTCLPAACLSHRGVDGE